MNDIARIVKTRSFALLERKEKKMIKPQKYFAAIRRDDEGKEWIDLNTISGFPKISGINAQQIDKECGPHWAKGNPVVRYAQIEIREVEQP